MSSLEHVRRAECTAVVLAVGACLLSAPVPAAANSYHDFLCRIPYGPNAGHAAPADDVTYATSDTYVYAGDGCPGGGSLYAAMDGGVSHPYGAGGWDTFTAPAGLTIAGGPYPVEGVTLDVAVREGGRWRIFDQVVANGKGRFRYSYRFHATTQPTTYTFRVALPHTGSGAYPYTPGASNTVKVRVNP